MTQFELKGVLTALVTPFGTDGSINIDAMSDLIEYQLNSGVTGIAVTAGAGEYVNLYPEERVEVVRKAASILQGRAPLVAGVLAADTGSAVRASLAAKEAGARALLLLTPYYVSPSINGIVDHFQRVAAQVGLPIVIYNNPGRTGINLDVQALERLVEIPEVMGIKECDRDLGRVVLKILNVGDRLTFMSGDDDLFLPILSIGAAGGIMAGTNLAAPWAVRIFEETQAGRWDKAQEIFCNQLLPFIGLYKGPDHPGPLKEALGLAGFPVGRGRPPLHPIGEERLRLLRTKLLELELISQT